MSLLVLFVVLFAGYILWKVSRPSTQSPYSSSAGSAGHETPPPAPKIRGTGRYTVEVVGESFYRDNLKAMFGVRSNDDEEDECDAEAELRLERNNPHDANAVSVYIRGRQVGHLSREMAKDFRAALVRDRLTAWTVFRVDAMVYRPDDDESHFSVTLDLPEEG